LGMVHPNDILLVLSHSGESEEIVRLLGPAKQLAMALVALTGNGGSTLAGKADVALVYGPIDEVCPLGLAPSTSTTAMIAVGDALLARPIRAVMTADPITVPQGTRVTDAVEVLRLRKISELPVVDAIGRPVGLLDITDLIGLMPVEAEEEAQVA